jgi:uncharacterized protein (UPF0333 family)
MLKQALRKVMVIPKNEVQVRLEFRFLLLVLALSETAITLSSYKENKFAGDSALVKSINGS